MNIINLLFDRVLTLVRIEIGRVARILHLHYQTARLLSYSRVRAAWIAVIVIRTAAQVLFGTITMMQVAVAGIAARVMIMMIPMTMFVMIMMLVVSVYKTSVGMRWKD